MAPKPNPQTWTVRISGRKDDLTIEQIRKLHETLRNILLEYDTDRERYIQMVCDNLKITREDLFSCHRPFHSCLGRWCLWRLLRNSGRTSGLISKMTGYKQATVDYGLRRLKHIEENEGPYKKQLAWLKNGAA